MVFTFGPTTNHPRSATLTTMKRSSHMKRSGFLKTRKALRTSQKTRERRIRDREWAMAVKTRDDFRCRRCNYRDEHNNHAHHRAPRSQRPDLVHELSNGLTVCPLCHEFIHRNPIESEALGFLDRTTYEQVQKQTD